jgi:hypothetical protein
MKLLQAEIASSRRRCMGRATMPLLVALLASAAPAQTGAAPSVVVCVFSSLIFSSHCLSSRRFVTRQPL